MGRPRDHRQLDLPTVVLTDLGRKAWAGEKGEAAKARIPMGRFAAARRSRRRRCLPGLRCRDMINGADLVVDGGYTIR